MTNGQLPPVLTNPYSESGSNYLNIYRENDTNLFYRPFRLESGQYRLGGALYEPLTGQEIKGVVLFLHGYNAHQGNYYWFISHLVRSGFIVAAADLPGHGLSSGERGIVNSFDDYTYTALSLTEWVNSIESWKSLPKTAIGHSTGALAFYTAVLKFGTHYERLVLGAPLVRSWLYDLSMLGLKTLGNVMEFLPLAVINDPLGLPVFPLSWLAGLEKWNTENQNLPVSAHPALLIYGGWDTAIEAERNITFLKSRFTNHTVYYLGEASHKVFQQDGVKEKVLERVLAEIKP